jgi:DNA replication protein DnaC
MGTMLKQPMIEKLAAMRLLGMAEALKAQEQDPSARELSFLERFGLLVDQQWSALAQKACRDGYSALYTRAQSLFRDLAMARADGSLRSLLARLSRIDVLVIDDWAMAPLSEPERRDFWEICEDRYQVRSTILTSQLPVSRWHEQIGDPTLADGILDRLVHNAHRIEMRGDSMRKNRGKLNA